MPFEHMNVGDDFMGFLSVLALALARFRCRPTRQFRNRHLVSPGRILVNWQVRVQDLALLHIII